MPEVGHPSPQILSILERGSTRGGTTLRRLMSRSGQAPHAIYNASFMQHVIAGRPDRIAAHSGRAQALSMPAICVAVMCVHCTPPQIPNVQGLNVEHMHADSAPMCQVTQEHFQVAATSHHIRQGISQGRHHATPPSHSPCLGCVAQVDAVPHLRVCMHTYMQGPETKRVALLEGLHTGSSCCMCAGAFRTCTCGNMPASTSRKAFVKCATSRPLAVLKILVLVGTGYCYRIRHHYAKSIPMCCRLQ